MYILNRIKNISITGEHDPFFHPLSPLLVVKKKSSEATADEAGGAPAAVHPEQISTAARLQTNHADVINHCLPLAHKKKKKKGEGMELQF